MAEGRDGRMQAVFLAIMVVGGLGLVAGAVLAFASMKFAVEVDPRVEELEATLPGVNCGACGHPSCTAAAKAIAEGKVPINTCVAGGEAITQMVARAMGVEAGPVVPRIAKVQCRGDVGIAKLQYEYHGIDDCRAAYVLFNGAKACPHGCLALGSCAKACPFDAIEYKFHRVPYVRYDKCTGCGVCVDVCPRNLIDLYGATDEVFVMCKSHDKGARVRKVCEVGCVACGVCERSCPFDAITVQDGLAVVEHSKCVKCGICVMMCPYNCIWGKPKQVRALITDRCNGCTICEKVCPANAVTGESKQLHVVDPDRCIACGLCVGKCPRDAIDMCEHEPALVKAA
ncbi:MAG: RnfABCDGE type electron transport complex subunit B [Candidatus Hydrogenedentota bacterium]|nr:MAG: RnfABCDGE type electron transport complex subunit B [Candidatus Hydrogenedentota bacterium]